MKLDLEAANRGKEIEKTKPHKNLKLCTKACFGRELMVSNVQATIVELSKLCFHLIFF